MYFASPSSGERFYLRLLLTVVVGATSFTHLRTVNNIHHNTYKEACFALGLLEDDQEWSQCLQEAGQMQTGYTLRMLFDTILFHCNPTSPVRNNMGKMWVYFPITIPVPMNTAPVQVRVRYNHGFLRVFVGTENTMRTEKRPRFYDKLETNQRQIQVGRRVALYSN